MEFLFQRLCIIRVNESSFYEYKLKLRNDKPNSNLTSFKVILLAVKVHPFYNPNKRSQGSPFFVRSNSYMTTCHRSHLLPLEPGPSLSARVRPRSETHRNGNGRNRGSPISADFDRKKIWGHFKICSCHIT